MRNAVPVVVAATGLLLVAAACGGGTAAGTQAATATTFTADRGVVSALQTMVTDASGASLFAPSGTGASQADDCAAAWAAIRSRVAQRDATTASTMDAAVAQLGTATRARDGAGATAATATITQAAADYTRLFP